MIRMTSEVDSLFLGVFQTFEECNQDPIMYFSFDASNFNNDDFRLRCFWFQQNELKIYKSYD